MAQIIARVASWLANEVVSKTLAKSAAFQRFAGATHQHVTKIQQTGTEHIKRLGDHEVTKQVKGEVFNRVNSATRFGSAFVRNLHKEIQNATKQSK